MIGFVRGILEDIQEGLAVVEAGGIGYNIQISSSLLGRLPAQGEEVRLYTYLSVREDAMQLYGFGSKEELSLFKLLIGVSGIGPKGGLAILSTLSPEELRFALISSDVKAISKAPGIGKKTAERLVLELGDRLSKETFAGEGEFLSSASLATGDMSLAGSEAEAVEALKALGYPGGEALKAVKRASALMDKDGEMDVQSLLKLALKEIL